MVSEHGWDYNTSSGPPQSWDHGKDAQSYYYIISWLDLIRSSGTALGAAELEASSGLETPKVATTGWDVEPEDVSVVPNNEAFEIIGHSEEVKEIKKDPGGWDVKPALGVGDGWLAEDTAPGVIRDGRIWRGVKRFRVPVLKDIIISEEPSVSKSNWVEPPPGSRGVYKGRRSGGGFYRGGGGRGGVRSTREIGLGPRAGTRVWEEVIVGLVGLVGLPLVICGNNLWVFDFC